MPRVPRDVESAAERAPLLDPDGRPNAGGGLRVEPGSLIDADGQLPRAYQAVDDPDGDEFQIGRGAVFTERR